MFSLEDKIRPPAVAGSHLRDLLGVGLLVLIGWLVAPAWCTSGQRYLTDVSGQMASFHLLVALAFLLVLRRGAIDLSVWATAAAGGLVAAELIRTGADPAWAFAAAMTAGATLGAINAFWIVAARLPTLPVTLVTAIAVTWLLRSTFDAQGVVISEHTFDGWLGWTRLPILVVRMLLVAGVYGVTMLAWLGAEAIARSGKPPSERRKLCISLCGSGAIAGLAGAIWLLDAGAAPVPRWPVGDLRIPAAAILAGGVLFAGRKRAMLAMVCLPPAMLLATIWKQQVRRLSWEGYELQMILLAGMTLVVHLSIAELADSRGVRRRLAPAAAVILSMLGMGLIAGGAHFETLGAHRTFYAAGLASWTAGAIALLAARAMKD